MQPTPSHTRSVKADTLGQSALGAVVDGRRAPPDVLLPRIATALTAPAGRLVAAERGTNLGTRGTDVDIDDTAVGPVGAEPLAHVDNVGGEEGRRETLGNGIVQAILSVQLQARCESGKRLTHAIASSTVSNSATDKMGAKVSVVQQGSSFLGLTTTGQT